MSIINLSKTFWFVFLSILSYHCPLCVCVCFPFSDFFPLFSLLLFLSLSLSVSLSFFRSGTQDWRRQKRLITGMADKLKIKINWSNEAIKGRIQAKNHCNDKTTGWLETSPQLQLSNTGLMLNDVKTNWSIAFLIKFKSNEG